MRTSGVGEASPPVELPSSGGPEASRSGGAAFAETLARERGGREQRDGSPGGPEERTPRAAQAEPKLRGAVSEGETPGTPLVAFHLPLPILHPPAPIARPPFEGSAFLSTAQAIAERVVQAAALEARPGGRLEFVVELRPEVLGGLEIRVHLQDGRVHALLASREPEVRALVEAQVHLLRQALEGRGLAVAEIAVSERRAREDDRFGGSGERGGGRRQGGRSGRDGGRAG